MERISEGSTGEPVGTGVTRLDRRRHRHGTWGDSWTSRPPRQRGLRGWTRCHTRDVYHFPSSARVELQEPRLDHRHVQLPSVLLPEVDQYGVEHPPLHPPLVLDVPLPTPATALGWRVPSSVSEPVPGRRATLTRTTPDSCHPLCILPPPFACSTPGVGLWDGRPETPGETSRAKTSRLTRATPTSSRAGCPFPDPVCRVGIPCLFLRFTEKRSGPFVRRE